jgi:cyclophilin family peptidyl-prolyl cis-trans isomerase
MGTITITLDPGMPVTAGNFESLVKKGYYDGTIFHRVIDGFMIQGGDPTGTGRGGPGTRSGTNSPARTGTTGAPSRWQTPAQIPAVHSLLSTS